MLEAGWREHGKELGIVLYCSGILALSFFGVAAAVFDVLEICNAGLKTGESSFWEAAVVGVFAVGVVRNFGRDCHHDHDREHDYYDGDVSCEAVIVPSRGVSE